MKINSPIGDNYIAYLKAFSDDKAKINEDASFQLFYDLYKIRQANYRYKRDVNRERISSTADIFQDLLARFLRIKLSKEYKVFLEYKEKHKKLQPDIMIKKNDKNWAIIEVKTTIGWDRGLISDNNYMKRVNELSKAYDVPTKKIFYVFESASNVTPDFAKIFLSDNTDPKNDAIKEYILALFKHTVGPNNGIENFYNDYTDDEIKKLYDGLVLARFDKILEKVK